MTTSADDELRRAAAELYGVPLDEFVASRQRLAEATDGREVAAAIRGLKKPAAAAAVVNALVRADPGALPGLAEIGDRLRAAEEDGDAAALRALSGERRRAVADATSAAVEGAGSPVSGSTRNAIEATLQASAFDRAAAAAAASGLLVKPLAPGADSAEATALSVDGLPSVPEAKKTAARSTKASEAAARKAREAAEQAEREADEAAARLRDAESDLDELRAEREQLRARLVDVRAELSDLEGRDSAVDGELARAQRARREAATAARKTRAEAAALRRAGS